MLKCLLCGKADVNGMVKLHNDSNHVLCKGCLSNYINKLTNMEIAEVKCPFNCFVAIKEDGAIL